MKAEFKTAVYQIVGAIPAGKVLSYGDVARLAGYPRHARFVGKVLSQLPDDSSLPWHRVLRGDGRLGPEGTATGDRQRQKLEAEGVLFLGSRVPRSFRWHP